MSMNVFFLSPTRNLAKICLSMKLPVHIRAIPPRIEPPFAFLPPFFRRLPLRYTPQYSPSIMPPRFEKIQQGPGAPPFLCPLIRFFILIFSLFASHERPILRFSPDNQGLELQRLKSPPPVCSTLIAFYEDPFLYFPVIPPPR